MYITKWKIFVLVQTQRKKHLSPFLRFSTNLTLIQQAFLLKYKSNINLLHKDTAKNTRLHEFLPILEFKPYNGCV